MAVDKKSDYYTSATNYRDLDGNMKTFTHIDYDLKTKVAFGGGRSRPSIPPPVLSQEQEFCYKVADEMGDDHFFIEEFDKLLKKYESERLKKGNPVYYVDLYNEHYGDNWFKDLKKLYERVQKRTN